MYRAVFRIYRPLFKRKHHCKSWKRSFPLRWRSRVTKGRERERALFSIYWALFDIGLFLEYIGLFPEYIGLFSEYIGLFSEYPGLFSECIGLF